MPSFFTGSFQRRPRLESAGAASYANDVRRVEQSLQSIKRHTAIVAKAQAPAEEEGERVERSAWDKVRSKTIHEPRLGRAKRSAWDEVAAAGRLLDALAVAATQGLGESDHEEQNARRLVGERLAAELAESARRLEDAVAAAAATPDSSPPSTHAPSTASPSVATDCAAEDLRSLEGGVEARRQPLLLDDSAGMVAMHTEIVSQTVAQTARIAKDTQGLQRLMADMAHHTTEQGTILDNIEANMSSAVDTTASAANQISEAAGRQKFRGWCIFVALFVVIVFCAVMVGVFWSRS